MSEFSNLEGKKPAALRDLAKQLKIIGRYQMDKAALIVAINATLAEKIAPKADAPKTDDPKPAATDPVSMAKIRIDDCREVLKAERASMLKETTPAGIASAKNKVAAAENRLRIAKLDLKEIKQAIKKASKGEGFSWKRLIGWTALGLTAAGLGVGSAMILDRGNGAEEVNGDKL